MRYQAIRQLFLAISLSSLFGFTPAPSEVAFVASGCAIERPNTLVDVIEHAVATTGLERTEIYSVQDGRPVAILREGKDIATRWIYPGEPRISALVRILGDSQRGEIFLYDNAKPISRSASNLAQTLEAALAANCVVSRIVRK